jgi:hypothetical protein
VERAYYSFRNLTQLTDEYLELLFEVRHLSMNDLVSAVDKLSSSYSSSDGHTSPAYGTDLTARLARSHSALLAALMQHLCGYLQMKAELARMYVFTQHEDASRHASYVLCAQ